MVWCYYVLLHTIGYVIWLFPIPYLIALLCIMDISYMCWYKILWIYLGYYSSHCIPFWIILLILDYNSFLLCIYKRTQSSQRFWKTEISPGADKFSSWQTTWLHQVSGNVVLNKIVHSADGTSVVWCVADGSLYR